MRRPVLPCFVVAFALAVPARATAASPADVAAADALFREARTAARRGDHATACPKFRASYQLDPAVGTLLNVADCEEHDGHLMSAHKRFEEALARLSGSDDRVPYVRSRIRALDERVPRIVGKVGPGAFRVQLKVDGVVATTTSSGISHPVDPGKHELHVEGAGRDEHVVVVVKEGERKEIDFARPLAPAPAPVATATPSADRTASPPEPRSNNSTLGLVIGGVGVGALAVSGVAIGLMFDAKKTADAHQGEARSHLGRDHEP
jgi:hypothetical protein